MKILENYDYQGNIRELMNIINSTVIIESSSEIKKKCLPSYILEATAPVERDIADGPFKTMDEMERTTSKRFLRPWRATRRTPPKSSAYRGLALFPRSKSINWSSAERKN